jgi:hypothetical protein
MHQIKSLDPILSCFTPLPLGIRDVLHSLCYIARQLDTALCSNFVRQPGVQQLIVAAESDGAATHDWNYGLGFHPLKEFIPKRIVQCNAHANDPEIGAFIRLPLDVLTKKLVV